MTISRLLENIERRAMLILAFMKSGVKTETKLVRINPEAKYLAD